MKRILFVITQSEMGGAQQFLAQLISGLNKDEFQCSLVVGSDGNNQLQKLLPPDTPYIIASHLRRNPGFITDIRSILQLRKIFRKQKPDIIFLNSSKAGFNGSIAARGLSSRVIYRIGGWTFNDPWPIWKKKLYISLEKLSAPWKDDIVLNNKKDLGDAEQLKIVPRGKLHYIPNGIDPYLEFLPREQALLELQPRMGDRLFLKEGNKIAGTIANFYPPKGLSDLVTAMASLPEHIISIIIGDGALRPALEEQIKRLNLEQRVLLLGHMDNASRIIPGFDVFVLPSWKEGFPWSVLEAMAAKVPVVTTSVGAIPDVLEDRLNGRVVPPRKPELLAAAISEVLADERAAQEMTIQAHQTLLKGFSVHEMIKKYEELFGS